MCWGRSLRGVFTRFLYRLLTERVLAYMLLLNNNALSLNLALSLIDRSFREFNQTMYYTHENEVAPSIKPRLQVKTEMRSLFKASFLQGFDARPRCWRETIKFLSATPRLLSTSFITLHGFVLHFIFTVNLTNVLTQAHPKARVSSVFQVASNDVNGYSNWSL